jgi:hypothetical protein
MTGGRLRFVAAGMFGSVLFFLAGCQPLALRELINKDLLPPNVTDPWVTSFGDRALTLSWAEPSDSDMGAVEIIATPTRATGVALLQAVIAAGTQGATLNLPTNNAGYTITTYMVDKAGHVADAGVSTKNSHSLHYTLDQAGHTNGSFPAANPFASQVPIKTVTHFQGVGAGLYRGYDSYTYDSVTGLPSLIISYDSAGTKTTKHEIHYATGSVNRVLDILSTSTGADWTITGWVNTYYDSSGRVTNTELYGGVMKQVQYASTYSRNASGELTGWVTTDGAGNVTQTVTYHDQGTREQWVICDSSGAIVSAGLVEDDYDLAGRSSLLVKYNTSNMSIASKLQFQYDANGNLLKTIEYGGTPLQQEEYDVYSY